MLRRKVKLWWLLWCVCLAERRAAEDYEQLAPAEERQKDLPAAYTFSILGCSTMLPFVIQAARNRLLWEAMCSFFLIIVSMTFYIHEAKDKAYAEDWQFFAGEVHYGMHWVQWQRIMSILTVTVGCSLFTLLLQNENRAVDGMLNALYCSSSLILFERDMWSLENTTVPFMIGLFLWLGKCLTQKNSTVIESAMVFHGSCHMDSCNCVLLRIVPQ